jgi:hypothetical protein
VSDLPEIGGGGGRGASMSCIHTSCMMYIIYYYISCTPTRVISILCIVYIISNMMRKRISLPLFLYTYIYIYISTCASSPPRASAANPISELTANPTHPSRFLLSQNRAPSSAVVVRSYIAELRGQIKQLESELREAEGGQKKSAADGGHGEEETEEVHCDLRLGDD